MFNKSTLTITTSALVLMSTGVAGAASNPFSDVPQDSWAYDAVATLAADGVIDGFPDGTYQGNKTMTRYEMAQIVARAMAKEDLQKADKAIVDKLAAEFAEECKKYGLIIRGNFDYSRITVGRMDQNEKMVGIIKKIIESGELKKI